jgi:multidrug efflux system membrane fusion protein
VVPAQGRAGGQQDRSLFVVKADNTVESRPVKVGRRLAKEVVIDQGVAAGERVVTDGQLRLLPGSRVDIKPPKPS